MNTNSIRQLVKEGVIHIGRKARSNALIALCDEIALGIANKDYPAQTPFLWNSVYGELELSPRNIRAYSDPSFAPQIFAAMKADSSYIGGDVGVGFKDRVLPLLDGIDPLARLMGAINVVVKTASGLVGYNTDGEGYAQSLSDVFAGRGEALGDKKVVLLGAGGTANAIAFALANRGCKLVIINRTAAKAHELAERINRHFGEKIAEAGGRELLPEVLHSADAAVAVIDDPASPLDQYSALAEIKLPATAENISENLASARDLLSELPKSLIVSDVMLRDSDTATIAIAKESGFTTLDGRPMVFNQAVEAFWLVNEGLLRPRGIGKERVRDIMYKAFTAGSAK